MSTKIFILKKTGIHALAVWTLYAGLPAAALGADPVADLATSLQQAAAALSTRGQEQIKVAQRTAAELDSAIKRSDARAAQISAQQLSEMTWLPDEMRRAVEKAQRELPGMIVAQRERFVAEVEKAIDNTRTQCFAATKESELLPLLNELSALRDTQSGGESNPPAARAIRKIDSAIKTTDTWMNYLSANTAGNSAQAVTALKQMEGAMQNYPILPAAEVERRIADLSPKSPQRQEGDIASAFARIKTLADVEAAGAEIEAITVNTNDPFFHELLSAREWFRSFRSATAAYFGGDFGDAWLRVNQANSDGGKWFPHTLRLRQMLLTELTPRVLKLPPGKERRPDETHEQFLERQFAEAAREGRWEDLQRMATLRSRISGSGSTMNGFYELSTAVRSFLDGRRMEETGDFPAAIMAYERVLRSTADFAPASEATDRLKALRQAHPEAFAEVHPRGESDLAMQLIRQLEGALKQTTTRLAAIEADRLAVAKANPGQPGAAPAPTASISRAEYQRIEQRLKEAEETIRALSTQNERLEKLELLFGPGAEALGRDFDKKIRFRIWLGPDYTVYRSALPPRLEKGLAWEVHYNGKNVLGRNAENEFAYAYYNLKPGDYTIYLRGPGPGGDLPASNVISFTVPKGEAHTKREDDDIDRDGIPNAAEGN